MQYKTITLELLRQYNRPMTIPSLDRYSADLKAGHLAHQQALLRANPANRQAASQALELAIQELQERLQLEAQQSEPESQE